jgi:hypothetical protein
MEIDPVQQGAGNPVEIFGHRAGWAVAFFVRVIVVTTRTWVHGCNEDE